LLGLLKGNTAWWGLFGIVTRISTRVYSFQPEKLEPVGLGKEGALQLPPRVHYQNYTLPSEDATKKAMLEISHEQIAAAQNRVPMFWRTIARSQSRQDFWDEWNKVNKEAIEATHILRVLFIGFTSQKQLDYEMKVADDIMKKYGGEARRTKQTDDSTFLYPTANAMWKPTGFYASQMVALASPRCTWKTNADELKVLDNYEHFFFKQHGEHPWYSPFNLGRVMYSEFMAIPDCEKFDPTNPKFDPNTIGAFLTFLESEVPKIMVENGQSNLFGMGFINSKNLLGPGMHNYHLWVQKLKKEFDPKGVCRKGCDDAMDVIIGSAPAIITEGFKQVAKRVAESGWKDTSGI
jgi:hypothetical protein